jgi:signal transduction histidine kinase
MQIYDKKRSIQKKVGILFLAISVLYLVHLLLLHFFGEGPEPRYLFLTLTVLLPLLLLALAGFIDHEAVRSVHVAVFILLAYVGSCINGTGEIIFILFYVVALLLAYQYGYLNRRPHLKIGIVILFGIIIRSYRLYRLGDELHIFSNAFMILGFIYLFYILFDEELREFSHEKHALEEQIEKDKTFTHMGKHMAGLIHNVKNHFYSIRSSFKLLEELNEEELDRLKLDKTKIYGYVRNGINELYTQLNNVMYLVGSTERTGQQIEIDMAQLIDAILELFMINLDFKHRLMVHKQYRDRLLIRGNPFELRQILEVILNNSYDAIRIRHERRKSRGNLRITIYRQEENSVVSIEDDGIGMEFFEDERRQRVPAKQTGFFQQGLSTKETGTGFGMLRAIELIDMYGGRLYISSKKGEGTRVDIVFPDSEVEGAKISEKRPEMSIKAENG